MKQFLPVSSPSSSSLLDKPPADKGQTRKLLLWLGVHGQSATNLVEESRLAGEFAANYDEDNDSANIKGDEKGALLRTVPLMGDDAWKLSETHTKPDTLLLLVDPETGITDLLDSPLVARSLCDGKPLVRVVRLLLDGAGVPPAAGPLLNRIGGGAIRDYRGRSGLRSLSEGIVECLNYREGIGAKPPLHDWLFPAGAAREVGSGMMEPNASVPTNAI
jgi:hypothetical protein